ncbi:MAG: hypothetical protein II240_00990 [Bacteroidaceae bacterium]|nr:hypothetical protein [Bacteroidaceae bacterium]
MGHDSPLWLQHPALVFRSCGWAGGRMEGEPGQARGRMGDGTAQEVGAPDSPGSRLGKMGG